MSTKKELEQANDKLTRKIKLLESKVKKLELKNDDLQYELNKRDRFSDSDDMHKYYSHG